MRAAALTYFTVLSLVPLLAFAFALLEGFGAYEVLVEGTVRHYIVLEQARGVGGRLDAELALDPSRPDTARGSAPRKRWTTRTAGRYAAPYDPAGS